MTLPLYNVTLVTMRPFLKKFLIMGLILFWAMHAIPALAQNTQAIYLKDGSVLKGRIIEVRNGYYTIQTKLAGQTTIHENDIIQINNTNNISTQVQAPVVKHQPSGMTLPDQQAGRNIQQELNSLSQNLLNDPEIRSAMEELSRDPEMMQIMGNQDLLKAIFSMNSATIQNDPSVQKLLQHPKMQKLMNMISQRIMSTRGLNANPAGYNR